MNVRVLWLVVIAGTIVTGCRRDQNTPSPVAKSLNSLPTIAPSNNNRISGYPVPAQMDFAGEEVPLNRPDIYERMDRELLVNSFWHSNSILLIKRSGKWLPTIDSILRANDIPSDFKYLAVAESGLQNVVSPAKAVGYWQLLKGTARDMGLIVNKEVDQRYDPILSTIAAIKYLKQAYGKYQNWTLVAASYNLGMHATSKILANQKAKTYYEIMVSEEPARYVFRILAIKYMLENPSVFGFEVDQYYELEATNTIVVNKSIDNWVDFAIANGTDYYHLKRLNPWIRRYTLQNGSGTRYNVKIPITK